MIAQPGGTFKYDGTIMQCVSVVDETGRELPDLVFINTKLGLGRQLMRGADDKPMTDEYGNALTKEINFHQLYFVVTAGPSEQVVQDITNAAVPQEESYNA